MRVGVIIPAYNAASWIGEAIESVLSQTHHNLVLVVVDDGSADPTAQIAGSFADSRIRLIRQANTGVSGARNQGMRELLRTGVDALIFLDSDDWLAPNALGRLTDALIASPHSVAAVGGVIFKFGDKRISRPPPSGDLLELMLVSNLFANCGQLLVRRTAVEAAGEFLPNLTFGEDWEFLTRVAIQGNFTATKDKAPVLFVCVRAGGAVHRLGTDPEKYHSCVKAIFDNPALLSRFNPEHLGTIRRHRDALTAWTIGRELIRHQSDKEGRAWLRRSFFTDPGVKSAAKVVVAHALTLLPDRWRGNFQPYPEAMNRVAHRSEPRREGAARPVTKLH